MRVGFTGTQIGMTDEQKLAVLVILDDTETPVTEFHHGNCIGADEQAAMIAGNLGITTIAHPGDTPGKQSTFISNVTFAPTPNLRRNHEIVDICELLIAAPKGPPQTRSGTWATIRYADKVNRKTLIIKPSGEVME